MAHKISYTTDALPAVKMYDIVTAIGYSSYIQGGDVIYAVYIYIEANPAVDSRLKWGMTVEVTFEPLKTN